jgi:hypothetical protein
LCIDIKILLALFITPEGGFSPPDRALGPWFKTTGFQPYSLSAGGSVRQFFMPPAFSWWLFTYNFQKEKHNTKISDIISIIHNDLVHHLAFFTSIKSIFKFFCKMHRLMRKNGLMRVLRYCVFSILAEYPAKNLRF